MPYLIPYLYDFVFAPNDKKEEEKTGLCIKISKTILTLFESFAEVHSNALMQKYGLTTVKFYKTDSLYSQFKTIVNGHTFQYYLMKGHFSANEQYPLRKAFVCFLDSVLNSKIDFWDFHGHNIMFDELKVLWEVVDGHICEREVEAFHAFKKNDNITRLFSWLDLPSHPVIQKVLNRLSNVARRSLFYNEEMDQKLLKKVSLLSAQKL